MLTPVDHARIRDAVADHAARYVGGPLGLGRDAAARYVSEGQLQNLVTRHGFGVVRDAVAAVIDADPAVLQRSEATRTRERDEREAHAERLATRAREALEHRNVDRALDLVRQAELIDPDHRCGRSDRNMFGYTWDDIRKSITKLRGALPSPADHRAEPATQISAAGSATTGTDHAPTAACLARLDTAPQPAPGSTAPDGVRHPSPRAVTAPGQRADHRL